MYKIEDISKRKRVTRILVFQLHRDITLPNLREAWVSIGEQLLKVCLKPSSSLRSRLKGIRVSAVSIVSRGGGVAASIALSTRLDPDKGIFQGVASVSCKAYTKTSTNHVAPISPSVLLGWLDTVAGYLISV